MEWLQQRGKQHLSGYAGIDFNCNTDFARALKSGHYKVNIISNLSGAATVSDTVCVLLRA